MFLNLIGYFLIFLGALLMYFGDNTLLIVGECIAIAGGFCLFTGINNKQKQKEEEENKFRTNTLLLLAKIMNSDGKQMNCELNRVKSTITRYYSTDTERRKALEQFQLFITNGQDFDLDEICTQLRNKLDFLAKTELIMELLSVAYADDEYLECEEIVIDQIVEKLEISQIQYNSIYTIFTKKYKQGYYSEKSNDTNNNKSGKEHQKQTNTKEESSDKFDWNKEFNKSRHFNNFKNSDWTKGAKKGKNSQKSNEHKSTSNSDLNSKVDPKIKEACDILGITNNASNEEIKKAYHALAVKYHPDKASKLGDEAIRQATETMKQINTAWEALKTARNIK